MSEIVYRSIAEPLPLSGGDGLTLEGYAAVFNTRASIRDHMGDYDEVIKPGAFTRSINARTPFLLYQHGRHPMIGQYPLGRIETLREDAKGLFVSARLTDTPLTAAVRDGIAAGAITGMSIAMECPKGKATWSTDGGTKLRTVHEAKLYELGPVLGPAYTDTTATVRAMLGALPADVRESIFDAPDALVREVINSESGRTMSTHAERKLVAEGILAQQKARRTAVADRIKREQAARRPTTRSGRAAQLRSQGAMTTGERVLRQLDINAEARRRGVVLPPHGNLANYRRNDC